MSFMEGTVDVPGAGPLKKPYVYIPAGLAGVYVLWRWYRYRQDSAAPATDSGVYTTTDLTDAGLNTAGGTTSITGNTGSTVTDATGDAIDTNAQWTNHAAEILGTAGYDTATVYAALGDFLARRALDKTEATIARAALAATGQPPVGGPYSIIEEAGTGTGTLAAPTNLRAWDKTTTTQIGMQWDPVSGASHYRIYRSDLGTEPIGDSFDTKFWAKGLQPHHGYSFYVRAIGTTGKEGGKSSVYTAKTTDVKLTRPTGLKSSAVTRTSFRVTCNPVSGATYYRWYLNGHGISPSDRPYKDITGLKGNTTYSVTVAADTTNQNPGPQSAALRVKTKR